MIGDGARSEASRVASVPFTASQLGEVPARADVPQGRVYDVDLPYHRIGRCRISEPVSVALGTRLDQVAAALTLYEERNGRSETASRLLGAGVDLEAQDGPAVAAAPG